ncbi:membrane protein [Actinoplanes philippinensis]|uniref:Type I phosphodiesterase / nucleotide pyrophosphatase n=1 Tax=Actinoplanes philippinensis TaxID=35752 RepID=A0A1I2K5D5_9ACTN|nr:alkaline phosphatase family protein [Actinoplanes philippinensis]GIE81089.1 membrane protein [Actinoplanes philippinensis]SFF60271.1 Type I phosphodiesterase / nucleotide pyrophosphatase [Actinoplanes philippinensis]
MVISGGVRALLRRARAVLRSALTTFVVLTLTLWLMPGVAASDIVDTLGLVVLVAVVGAVLRPLLLVGITALGGWAAMLLGVVTQIAVMVVALRLDPGNRISGLPTLVTAAILAVIVAALLDWMADAGSDDTFVREARRLMRGVRRRAAGRLISLRRLPAGTEPGLLIIQLDGVAEPVLRWAIRAGNLPTLGDWLRSGSHTARGWHTGLPSTTPASQAGILHGASRQIPGFRWYEKETGKLMVSNRPRDAAIIESRLTDGQGLLRDGGVSISNAFSGDATTSLLTISHAALPGRTARGWAAFMASPYGFTRALVLGGAEVVTELHQARLQRRRNLQPRVSRSGAFLALRPASMLLRDVNISLVSEQMARGAPVIYCDLVDYDEVAHHAGPARPESMRQLESLDRMLGVLRRLTPEAARRYHLVVLSDHGQSQGPTFRQRHGETLEEVVGRLADEALVVSSGNLSMVYLTRFPHRLRQAAIEHAHPALISGLAGHPGVGVVVVQGEDGPMAYGSGGSHRLRDGVVVGLDPLTPYGPHARADLLRHQSAAHVGDLVVISAVDPATQEVSAFEELVGSHGGLGGWQTDAMLVHPASWTVSHDLDGPDAVHRQLVDWLVMLGLRKPEAVPLVAVETS